jgi:hypothetical protein
LYGVRYRQTYFKVQKGFWNYKLALSMGGVVKPLAKFREVIAELGSDKILGHDNPTVQKRPGLLHSPWHKISETRNVGVPQLSVRNGINFYKPGLE